MNKKKSDIDEGFVEIDVNEDTINPEEEALQAEAIEKVRKSKRKSKVVEEPDEDEDDEDDEFEHISFKNIIGGDILQTRFFLSKIAFIIFCVVLMLLYTGNRYGSLQDIITIDSLTRQLNKVHYEVLTQSSDLLNLSRQSNIERKLYNMGDTMMLKNNNPPFAIVDDE